MTNHHAMRRFHLLIALSVVVLDRTAKWVIAKNIPLHDSIQIIPDFFRLTHVENRGAAFGILSEADLPHQSLLFSAISIVALLAIAIYAFRLPPEARLPRLALSLVLGGALGNLVDRVRLGYVVDFIHAYWGRHQWPDFNMADSAITVGVTLLLLDMLRSPERKTDMAGAATPAGRIE